MVKTIKCLLEDYFNNTEQMEMLLKNSEKEQKRYSKDFESRKQFIISILGKVTYNKYVNKGELAPVPMSALRLNYADFESMSNTKTPVTNDSNTVKLINELKKFYAHNDLKFVNNGTKTPDILTNIIFKDFNAIIDFFINLKKSYKKVYKTDTDINWKAIVTKFRSYLK